MVDAPAYKARFGLNAVPVDAPAWQEWKDAQMWIGVTNYSCDKEWLRLYCLEI